MFWIQEKSHYQKPPVEPKIIFLLIAKKKIEKYFEKLGNWVDEKTVRGHRIRK